MTLMRTNLANSIPGSKTLKEAGEKAGWSYKSRNMYRANTKKHLAEIFEAQGVTKESLKQAYEQCLELCKKKEDYSTLKATIDSLAKLFGHLKEGNNLQAIEKVVISYGETMIQPPKGQEVASNKPD